MTNGRLDGSTELAEAFGTWEQIFQRQPFRLARSLDGRHRKRRLVKIIGE